MKTIIGTLREAMGSESEADFTDGLRLAWPGRSEWLHVRPSGTEPILRIITESPNAERAEALAEQATVCVARASGAEEE